MCAIYYKTIFVSVPAVNSCTLEGWDGLEWLPPHSEIITTVQNVMRFDCMFSMLFHWEALCNLETDDNIAFSSEEKNKICISVFFSFLSEHLSKMVTQKDRKLHMRIKKKETNIICSTGNYPQRETHWCQVMLGSSAEECLWSITRVQLTCWPDQSHGRQVISGAVESGKQVLANECQGM